MDNASLLVLVAGSVETKDIDPILQSAATRQMHLSFLVLGTLPRPPLYAYGMQPYGIPIIPESWQDELEEAKSALSEKAREIETRLEVAGASGEVEILGCEPIALPPIVCKLAATCDGVIISSELREYEAMFRNAVHGALFQSPSGVILNPIAAGIPLQPTRIFVAWDTSLPAARAAHIALPLLKGADDVTIGVFDPVTAPNAEDAGSNVARWLSHHACKVDLQQFPSSGEEIGACIQKRAAEVGAELIVMGAYGHSRMRQAVFGGTTRSLIDQTDIPVLLAH